MGSPRLALGLREGRLGWAGSGLRLTYLPTLSWYLTLLTEEGLGSGQLCHWSVLNLSHSSLFPERGQRF